MEHRTHYKIILMQSLWYADIRYIGLVKDFFSLGPNSRHLLALLLLSDTQTKALPLPRERERNMTPPCSWRHFLLPSSSLLYCLTNTFEVRLVTMCTWQRPIVLVAPSFGRKDPKAMTTIWHACVPHRTSCRQ